MSETKVKDFKFVDLPDYDYSGKLACPGCYKPVDLGRKNGHCDDCLKSKDMFPINYRREAKKKDEEEDPYAEESPRESRRKGRNE